MLVEFLEAFEKDLNAIPSQGIRRKVITLIERIELSSSLSDISHVKKLSGFKSAYRIRLGDYRIGVFVTGTTIQFARILHRKEIYKMFP
jgi:mRNA interferase RelE/StbE